MKAVCVPSGRFSMDNKSYGIWTDISKCGTIWNGCSCGTIYNGCICGTIRIGVGMQHYVRMFTVGQTLTRVPSTSIWTCCTAVGPGVTVPMHSIFLILYRVPYIDDSNSYTMYDSVGSTSYKHSFRSSATFSPIKSDGCCWWSTDGLSFYSHESHTTKKLERVLSTDDTSSFARNNSYSVESILCQFLFGSSSTFSNTRSEGSWYYSSYAIQNLSVICRTVSPWVNMRSTRRGSKGGRYSEAVVVLEWCLLGASYAQRLWIWLVAS